MKSNAKYSLPCIATVLTNSFKPESKEGDAALAALIKDFDTIRTKSLVKVAVNLEQYVAAVLVLAHFEEELEELHTDVFTNQLNFINVKSPLTDMYAVAAMKYLKNRPAGGLENPGKSPLPMSIFVIVATSKHLKLNVLEEL